MRTGVNLMRTRISERPSVSLRGTRNSSSRNRRLEVWDVQNYIADQESRPAILTFCGLRYRRPGKSLILKPSASGSPWAVRPALAGTQSGISSPACRNGVS